MTRTLLLFSFLFGTAFAAPDASEILEKTGVEGGFVVQLGLDSGELTTGLKANDSFQVQGLDSDASKVDAVRKFVQEKGNYGDVSVDRLTNPKRLPYIDNLVNLVVSESPGAISDGEILRVLVPNGVAYIKREGEWKKTVKPVPDEIDEWTHFLHSSNGNAVANDTRVGPPKHLQWIGSPRWSRHHDRMASMSAMVTGNGRLFYIMDEGSRISIQLPPKWKLVARDAFNGTILWKLPIPNWHNHLWPLKSGPTQLARRLVSKDDLVFCTMGLTAPVSSIDAATGATVNIFAESGGTEELVVEGDQLICLVNKGVSELASFGPQVNTGDQGRVRSFVWNKVPREVQAYDVKTGKLLWKKESKVAPLTLSASGPHVYIYDGEKVVALDKEKGEQKWASTPVGAKKGITFNFGPKLLIQDGVVLFAGGDRKMSAFDENSGDQLWSSGHERGGYQSPEDLLVLGNTVWSAPTTSGRDSGEFTGRNLKTGEVKQTFKPNVTTYWFHHRCYIAKATTNFLLTSRTGVEFVDPTKSNWEINHWVRGGCLYGVMPANGLTYAPPHNCACYPEAKLYGMNALAPASASREAPKKIDESNRLEKGVAYGKSDGASATEGDWPTYRGSFERNGSTKQAVDAADLKTKWTAKLDGRLSTLTAANEMLFVSQIDKHTVHALKADSGEKVWSFTTGGRVDSPPTYHKGSVLFGSADGYVYRVRATDGVMEWRYRAAPRDERLMSFEQIESVWPVQGNILVDQDKAFFVAGRSYFLDGGLRFFRLDATTGTKEAEKVLDDMDPDTDKPLQSKIATLQMPVGLPDILSTDGKHIFMRSQKFDRDGNRIEIGPNSGDFAGQGSVQQGDGVHLFSPTGYMDDSYFHRSYWVYGRSFAGGHGGYYQAGKYAPSGRLLVANDTNVFGFGRKPEYLRWTTTIEHHLFSAPVKQPPTPEIAKGKKGGKKATKTKLPHIEIPNAKALNPSGKPIVVSAWVKAKKGASGVVVARGGPADGYALVVTKGRPEFVVRSSDYAKSVIASEKISNDWTHLVGVLTPEKQLKIFVNGKLDNMTNDGRFVSSDPIQSMQIGLDDGGGVGEYQSPYAFPGAIDDMQVFFGGMTDQEAAGLMKGNKPGKAKLVLSLKFDGAAKDLSESKAKVQSVNAKFGEGKSGKALVLATASSAPKGKRRIGTNQQRQSYHVKHDWTQDIPVMVRAMMLANETVFVAGPPDYIDEEKTFSRIVGKDKGVQEILAKQDAAFDGADGGVIYAANIKDGTKVTELKLPSLPVWDGLISAGGKIFMATTKGEVICLE